MIQFQLLDISSDDIEIDGVPKFIITLYGKTDLDNNDGFNKNIVCHIEDFRPYFYLKIPDWGEFIKSSFFGERYLNIEHLIYDKKNSQICDSYEF